MQVGAANDVVSCVSWRVLLLGSIGNRMRVGAANDVVSCVSWRLLPLESTGNCMRVAVAIDVVSRRCMVARRGDVGLMNRDGVADRGITRRRVEVRVSENNLGSRKGTRVGWIDRVCPHWGVGS